MSLCIAVVTPEGIVMAGESRQTQFIANVNRVASDSAYKVFGLTETIFACTAGWGLIQPQNATVWRTISSLIDDFRLTIPTDSGVQTVAALLWAYFNGIYQEHIVRNPTVLQPGHVAINFVVAGYDPGSRIGTLFQVDIPSPAAPTQASRTTDAPGSWWIGQTDVAARIINGFDPRAINLPFVQAANQQNNVATNQLIGLRYAVNFGGMPMQDAIDFAVGLIQITTMVQRFSAGIQMQLGAVAGVGGPIDVAVVRPNEHVSWIIRKQLHV